jgi:hypothetical protein
LRQTGGVKIDGWNYIPQGYGLDWDLKQAPWWLRLWFHIPLFDRFAYPVMIRRGHAWLGPFPDWDETHRDLVPEGWQVRATSVTVEDAVWLNVDLKKKRR